MLARILKTVATAHQILISSYLQCQLPEMKCSDMRKCVYKTVEAFLDPMSSVFFWALWLSSMDISQTRFWGRSEVFALCLCFSNSKKRIIVFISYERLLTLPPRKTIFIGWVETAVVATIVEGIILSPANILIRRVIIERFPCWTILTLPSVFRNILASDWYVVSEVGNK